MEKRIISIFANDTHISLETKRILSAKLESAGFLPRDGYTDEAELLVCIGGDGATLEALHKHDFPNIPIIGINTGHLGFFQEIHPEQLDDFIYDYKSERYSIQSMSTVKARVRYGDREHIHRGLNEIVIRGSHCYTSHLNISIGGSFIERFSGDGIIVSTPAGSTAYNYSIGGSIVDPRLRLLQVTPIGPMNTTAYRSFTSSLLLPSDLSLEIVPENSKDKRIYIIADGFEAKYDSPKGIKIEYAKTEVRLMRFENYDFWNKVKTKFL